MKKPLTLGKAVQATTAACRRRCPRFATCSVGGKAYLHCLSHVSGMQDLLLAANHDGASKPASDRAFIRHIAGHLRAGQCVICKICGKSAVEITAAARRGRKARAVRP